MHYINSQEILYIFFLFELIPIKGHYLKICGGWADVLYRNWPAFVGFVYRLKFKTLKSLSTLIFKSEKFIIKFSSIANSKL